MKFELRPKPGVQPQEMPETLQKRLTAALQGDNDEALRQVLGEASTFAHPDTTVVDRGDKKPGATRLLRSLEHLSVPPDVPVTSYGDQASDVKQLQTLAEQGRHVDGASSTLSVATWGRRSTSSGFRQWKGAAWRRCKSLGL